MLHDEVVIDVGIARTGGGKSALVVWHEVCDRADPGCEGLPQDREFLFRLVEIYVVHFGELSHEVSAAVRNRMLNTVVRFCIAIRANGRGRVKTMWE